MAHQISARCKSLEELDDYLAFMVLYAPDYFPAWRNLDLGSAFQQLNTDIASLESCFQSPSHFQKAKELAQNSFTAYSSGNSVQGAHALQDLMQCLKGVRT